MTDSTAHPRLRFLLFLTLLVGAIALWRNSSSESDIPSVPETLATKHAATVSTTINQAESVTSRARLDPSSTIPPDMSASRRLSIPSQGATAAEVLSQLRDAADRGDSGAACRVGIELSRCFSAHRQMADAESEASYADQELDSAKADESRTMLAAIRNKARPDLERCEGIEAVVYKDAWSYLVQAASAGNAAAAASFYTSPPVLLATESSEVMDAWAAHREEYRDLAIKSGNVEALSAAAVAAATGAEPAGNPGEYPTNPYGAVKYVSALLALDANKSSMYWTRLIQLQRAQLSPVDFEAAQREGQFMSQEYFSNVKPTGRVDAVGTLPSDGCGVP